MKRVDKKTNPRYSALISTLKEASRVNGANLWREIAKRLEAPNRNYAEVNISKISRYAKKDEIIIVPGKVLGSGVIDLQVSVAALNFSDTAASKIKDANGKCMTIEDLLRDNPNGKCVRILR